MKGNEVRQNLRLGLFVLIGILIFLTGVFYLGSQNNVFNRTFTAYAVFKNVEGLNKGDNVWLSGVKIGTVKDVSIADEGRVLVELSLKDNQHDFVKRNATAIIGSDGLVGNKIVIIRPGNAAETILDNDTINTTSPTDTQDLFNLAKDVGENTRTLTTQLKNLVEKLNKGEGVVGELLNEDGAVSRDIRFAVDKFKTTSVQASQATARLNEVMNEVNNGEGLVNHQFALAVSTRPTTSLVWCRQAVALCKKAMRYTAEQIKTAIGEWQSSGLSKKAFCLQRDICPQTFYNWLKRIDAIRSSGFTKVMLPVPDQSRGFEIIFPSGARMIIQGEPSASWLREVLR